MKYIIKKYITISALFIIITLILVNCKQDDLNLQENSSVRDLSYTTKTVNASKIPTIMNFITNKVSKNLKIEIDDSLRKDITHTKSSEDDITVGEIITNNIKTITDSSQKTNYSFKITKEEPTALYFLNLIVKETNNGDYAYIVKYEYTDSNWVFNGYNFDTFIGKKVFYSPTGKYLAKFDINNGVISNKNFGSPCPDDDGDSSNNNSNGGTSNSSDSTGNGTPLGGNPIVPGSDWAQGDNSSNSGGSSSTNSGSTGSSSTGSGTEMGILGPCDQLYVNNDMFEDSDGKPIPITVDCNNIPIVSKSSKLGGLLKSGGIDSNGDCVPDALDDGYEDPIDDNDENNIEPININLGIISQLYNLTGQALTPEQNLWVSNPNNLNVVNNIINFLNQNQNSQQAQDFALDVLIELATNSENNNYTTNDYPGDDLGYEYQWWLNEDFIENSGNFNIDDEKPNKAEIIAFGLYPKEAILHAQNSITALNRAQTLAPSFSDGANGIHNGKADAFRHAYWNALGTAEFGAPIMKIFADAHEWGSTNQMEVNMDLFNNNVGRNISINNNYGFFTNSNTISDMVLQFVLDGSMKYINNNGNLVFTNQ